MGDTDLPGIIYKPQQLRTNVSGDFQKLERNSFSCHNDKILLYIPKGKVWETSIFPREGLVVKIVNSASQLLVSDSRFAIRAPTVCQELSQGGAQVCQRLCCPVSSAVVGQVLRRSGFRILRYPDCVSRCKRLTNTRLLIKY